jgi:hypothetical protein
MNSHPGTKYSFSGHETFALRLPWLPKIVRTLPEVPDLFSREDAMVTLGVGKNMVRSMRHWASAMELIEPVNAPVKGEALTELGERLLSTSKGWDPYLDDPATPWLLHWQLVSRLEAASTWFLAFTVWSVERFGKDELIAFLLEHLKDKQVRISETSIRRDVDVFLRTYVSARSDAEDSPEEHLDGPLVELGLIRTLERGRYCFSRTAQPTLPDAVFSYAVLKYWERVAPGIGTITLEGLMHHQGSPGGVFQLTEGALVERLERLPGGLRFDDTAGLRMVIREGDWPDPILVLERYYAANNDTKPGRKRKVIA